jgi:Stigma-specific protein, Stig1
MWRLQNNGAVRVLTPACYVVLVMVEACRANAVKTSSSDAGARAAGRGEHASGGRGGATASPDDSGRRGTAEGPPSAGTKSPRVPVNDAGADAPATMLKCGENSCTVNSNLLAHAGSSVPCCTTKVLCGQSDTGEQCLPNDSVGASDMTCPALVATLSGAYGPFGGCCTHGGVCGADLSVFGYGCVSREELPTVVGGALARRSCGGNEVDGGPNVECVGAEPIRSCGKCGTETVHCNSGTGVWELTGVCDRQGVCEPGTSRSCTNPAAGVQRCGIQCTWGTCTCPGGTTSCGASCVDLVTDNSNCGRCGADCGSGHLCDQGLCSGECSSRLIVCGGSCVDTQSDEDNCGACGNACGAGQNCSAGVCVSLPGR